MTSRQQCDPFTVPMSSCADGTGVWKSINLVFIKLWIPLSGLSAAFPPFLPPVTDPELIYSCRMFFLLSFIISLPLWKSPVRQAQAAQLFYFLCQAYSIEPLINPTSTFFSSGRYLLCVTEPSLARRSALYCLSVLWTLACLLRRVFAPSHSQRVKRNYQGRGLQHKLCKRTQSLFVSCVRNVLIMAPWSSFKAYFEKKHEQMILPWWVWVVPPVPKPGASSRGQWWSYGCGLLACIFPSTHIGRRWVGQFSWGNPGRNKKRYIRRKNPRLYIQFDICAHLLSLL